MKADAREVKPWQAGPVPAAGSLQTAGRLQGWMLMAPALLLYALFALYPMVDVFVLSFQKWNGFAGTRAFVGLDNYVYIFRDDPVFWMAFRNTLVWTALAVTIPPLIGFALAMSLNTPVPGRGALRAIFYLPVIIAPIVVENSGIAITLDISPTRAPPVATPAIATPMGNPMARTEPNAKIRITMANATPINSDWGG